MSDTHSHNGKPHPAIDRAAAADTARTPRVGDVVLYHQTVMVSGAFAAIISGVKDGRVTLHVLFPTESRPEIRIAPHRTQRESDVQAYWTWRDE